MTYGEGTPSGVEGEMEEQSAEAKKIIDENGDANSETEDKKKLRSGVLIATAAVAALGGGAVLMQDGNETHDKYAHVISGGAEEMNTFADAFMGKASVEDSAKLIALREFSKEIQTEIGRQPLWGEVVHANDLSESGRGEELRNFVEEMKRGPVLFATQENDAPQSNTVTAEKDPGTYLAPRETISPSAFDAADAYIAKYGIYGEVHQNPEVDAQAENDKRAIAEQFGVSEIDMLQAFRWRSVDRNSKDGGNTTVTTQEGGSHPLTNY